MFSFVKLFLLKNRRFNIITFQIFICLFGWALHCRERLSLVAASGSCSCLQCVGFSLWWPLPLQSTGSRACGLPVVARGLSSCGSWALEHKLSSCVAQAHLPYSMWDLRRSRIEPVSPALADGFFTTKPPGKPRSFNYKGIQFCVFLLWSLNNFFFFYAFKVSYLKYFCLIHSNFLQLLSFTSFVALISRSMILSILSWLFP